MAGKNNVNNPLEGAIEEMSLAGSKWFEWFPNFMVTERLPDIMDERAEGREMEGKRSETFKFDQFTGVGIKSFYSYFVLKKKKKKNFFLSLPNMDERKQREGYRGKERWSS